jgi:flavin-dependent dehydrogenase
MAQSKYDAVIVGARCAGASLAAFLAREGLRVLVVDRDAIPSDQVLSTHTIHPPGMGVLDELGVGDAVRREAPASPTMRLRKGDAWADITFPGGLAERCPRRKRLDGLLADAAIAAGAELRDRTRATAVRFDDDRAVGVQLRHGETVEEVDADLVVGADGRRSFVARQVGAEEYMAYDAPRAMYWAYWNAPATWSSTEYPFDMYVGHVGPNVRVLFQTDGGQLLAGCLPPADDVEAWRTDAVTALCADLAREPVIGPLLGGAAPDSEVRGTIKERYFFRRAAGQGWVLVGDAGHHKDFVIGDGITEALLQARRLATVIAGEGTDAALERWWRERDVRALPAYYWGREEGSVGNPGTLESLVIERIARSARLQAKAAGLPLHECSAYDAVPFGTVLRALLDGLARGKPGVIPEFLAQAKRIRAYERAMKEREALVPA